MRGANDGDEAIDLRLHSHSQHRNKQRFGIEIEAQHQLHRPLPFPKRQPGVIFRRSLASCTVCTFFKFIVNVLYLFPVSQGSFIKFSKTQISQLDRKLSESEAKSQLLEKIEDYRREKILLAGEAIMNFAKDKIKDGDVIMTYSCSSVITKVLVDVSGS